MNQPLSITARPFLKTAPARAGMALSSLTLACLLAPAVQAESGDDARLDTVTVISTGVRGAQRTVADSPTPIDIINADQLLKTGRAELSEAISKLLPSFNFGANTSGFQSTTRPLTNRGLGPAYTLVLVNGKRRHNGAMPSGGNVDTSGANAVDLDLIPVSAVERIEVLKDSAAAQYGSDAVAGVINVILKSGASGGHFETSYGQLTDGQGENIKFAGNKGFAIGDSGFLQLSGDARKRNQAFLYDKADANYRGYAPGDARQDTWDRRALKNGDPDLEAFNLGYNAELPLTDSTKVYSYATYGERDAQIYNNKRLAYSTASIPELFPDGYDPLNNIKDTDWQFLVGGKGEISEWNWDLSTTYGRNKNHHSSDLTINPTYGPLSPTSFDDLATLQFDQWVNNFDITRHYDSLPLLPFPVQVSAGLEHRWERFQTFAGSADAYTVGSYTYPQFLADGSRNPLYTLSTNSGLSGGPSRGAQSALVIRPEDEADLDRNNFAGYLDFGLNPSDRWYIGLAGRVEHYDDIKKNTFALKLNSRYELTDTVAVRGTIGTGFRAPSLTQLGYSVADNRTGVNADGVVVPALRYTATPGSALAKAFGASELDPEKTRNIGLGLTWQPARRTSVTLDAYVVDIDDRIVLSQDIYDRGNGTINNTLRSLGVAEGSWVTYYTNAFDTRTRGLDLVFDHLTPLGGFGDVRWSAAFNWNKTTVEGRRDTPADLAASGIAVVGHAAEGNLVAASPKTKWVLGANWSIDRFVVNLQTTRYGKVETWAQNATADRSFDAKWITDLDIAYSVTDNLTASIGGTNIFNTYPERNGVVALPSNGGQGVYGNPPFSPNGGFWYTKLAYDF
ncbi:TonB-dependent receptor [Pseudomonas sp. 3A(2025)]